MLKIVIIIEISREAKTIGNPVSLETAKEKKRSEQK